jgi:hypothetical protein
MIYIFFFSFSLFFKFLKLLLDLSGLCVSDRHDKAYKFNNNFKNFKNRKKA